MKNPITSDKYRAVLFDLDGVLTSTEKLHSACWKQMFDEFLTNYCKDKESKPAPFNLPKDYLEHVDGKPRYKGVEDFLISREIELPFGSPGDKPDSMTVCGLGNRKNELFNSLLNEKPVEVYKSSIELVRHLKYGGFSLAVVSSSKNCRKIMDAAEIKNYFEVVVDGLTAEESGLSGKPEPDTYLEAAKKLGVPAAETVVIEDASSGVEAGRNGNFGLVIGIARKNNSQELKNSGADIVVNDLAEIELQG